MEFEHKAMNLEEDKNLVYTAMSKHLFYYKKHISKFVVEQHKVPLNPFMIFDYFLTDTVHRDLIREANNNLVKRSDELWVFGAVSDGVLAEIKIFKAKNKPVKFFKIVKSKEIIEVSKDEVEMEEEVKEFKHEL
jgi:hypothetical protein